MTELINAMVTHKTFGAGKITKVKNGFITIQFDTGEKEFLYPDAFKPVLILEDSLLMKKINESIKATENHPVQEAKKTPLAKVQKEPIQKPKSKKHTDLDGIEHLKIGVIVRTVLRSRLENGHVDQVEIDLMQTKAYSRDTFHIQFPLLLKLENTNGDKPLRYYATPISIWGQYYYLCSEWFEVPANNDRPFLMKWLILHK